jgi:hypothetical protein
MGHQLACSGRSYHVRSSPDSGHCRSHAARNAAFASLRVSATPPFGPCVGWNIPLCVQRHSSRPVLRNRRMRPTVRPSYRTS